MYRTYIAWQTVSICPGTGVQNAVVGFVVEIIRIIVFI